ncbi:hypothetical protein ACOKW7_15570 [Limnospira platensis CENA597]|nr:hypothetical protein [Arthrospira sp. PLM2.Bin9]
MQPRSGYWQSDPGRFLGIAVIGTQGGDRLQLPPWADQSEK